MVNELSECGETIAVVYGVTKRIQEKLFLLEDFRPAFLPYPTDCPWVSEDEPRSDPIGSTPCIPIDDLKVRNSVSGVDLIRSDAGFVNIHKIDPYARKCCVSI